MRDGKTLGYVKSIDIAAPTLQASEAYRDLAMIVRDVGEGVRAVGHWISYPRKWKRKRRKDAQAIYASMGYVKPRPSRGWRKHRRKVKAK